MLRKLALSLAVSAALGVSQASALGLGEIRVNSALNEPLDAEIRLTQVRDLSPLQIQPKMASLDEYAAGNSTLARYLRDIQFQVLVSPEGTGRIRMKSIDPVLEPFLNFMVEVNWPSGRLVREYTVLLDPPVFDAAPVIRPVNVAAPVAEPVARVADASAATPPPERQVKAPNPRVRATTDDQIRVGTSDTLWRLAARNKPAGTTEHQMMLALLRKNPQSFLSGNINGLKAGTVMQVPTQDEVQAVSHKEAVAEIARQMQLWRDGKADAGLQAAPVDVSKDKGPSEATNAQSSVAPTEKPAEQSQLSIVAPVKESSESGQTAPAGESVDTSTTEGAAAGADGEQVITDASRQIENEMLMAQEQIDVLERENADLNNTLKSVLEQLESQSRMIELQSQQMATLQAELDRKAAQTPASTEQGLPGLLENPVVLGGMGAGALAVLAGLWLVLRRRGSGKADAKRELVSVPDNLKDDGLSDASALSASAVAGGALAGGVAAGAVLATADSSVAAQDEEAMPPRPAPLSSEEDEEEFSRPPMQALAPEEPQAEDLNDDLQSLDLDMDLDLDDLDTASEAVPGSAVDAVSELDAAEFDLSADELDTLDQMEDLLPEQDLEELSVADIEAEAAKEIIEPVDVDLEQELEFNVAPLAADEDDATDLDALLGNDGSDAEELDFMLQANADTDAEELFAEDEDDDTVDDLEALLAGSLNVSEAPAPAPATDSVDANADNSLHETVDSSDDLDFELDSDLEAMLAGSVDDEDDKPFGGSPEAASSDLAVDDLDSLLADFDPEMDVEAEMPPVRAQVEEELTSNISHDLEMDLDAAVDEMLGSTDDEIELSEERHEEAIEILDKMNLLSGADETETKLDLARAYLEMEDQDGARDILEEIASEGSDSQKQQARALLESLD